MKYLIINADDFGKFHSVNSGIIKGISSGIITSTSVLVYGKHVKDVERIKDLEKVSIGLHFDPSNLSPDEYPAEFFRQLNSFTNLVGRKPDHIDSHKIRLYDLGKATDDIKKYALENNVPLRDMGYAHFIDSFFGLSREDYKTIEIDKISPRALINILSTELKVGLNELMCHAGFVDAEVSKSSSYTTGREIELSSLFSKEFSDYLKDNPEIQLVSWKYLSKQF